MVCVATADISTFVIINARHFNQRTNARQEAVSHCAYGGSPALTQSCVSVMHVPNALMFKIYKDCLTSFSKHLIYVQGGFFGPLMISKSSHQDLSNKCSIQI